MGIVIVNVPLFSQQEQTGERLQVLKEEGALFLALPHAEEQMTRGSKIDRKRAVKMITNFYMEKAERLVKTCQDHISKVRKIASLCPTYLVGLECSINCRSKHEVSHYV